MGRRKKLTEAEQENTQTTLTIEDSNQAESEEADLLAETDAEVVAEAPEEAVKPRTRKSRSKKEEIPAVEETPEEEIVETVEASEAKEIEQIEESVKKPRKPRTKKTEEAPQVNQSTPVGPEAVPTTLDQWAAIKQLSESVTLLLEKQQKIQLNPVNTDLGIETNEFLRPQTAPKTLFITKFATAASIVAVLLSLVSLSLSQSARQAVLGALDPMKQSQLGVAVRPNVGGAEEATPFRKSPRRR